jgi:hypothetical protein
METPQGGWKERRSPSDPLVDRVRGEYGEMPGLRLTLAQACRLWQMDAVACETVLQVLITEGFLARTEDGAFIAMPTTRKAIKASSSPIRHQRSA